MRRDRVLVGCHAVEFERDFPSSQAGSLNVLASHEPAAPSRVRIRCDSGQRRGLRKALLGREERAVFTRNHVVRVHARPKGRMRGRYVEVHGLTQPGKWNVWVSREHQLALARFLKEVTPR